MRGRHVHALLRHPLLALFLCYHLGLISQGGGSADLSSSRKVAFDVGVVLETNTLIGNISWSCMNMAADDFYAANPGYSTRLSLHLRDSGGDAVDVASAAIDLLKNVQVQAIIGPQKSALSKFVIELGEKAHVPIISFSAKSPSLSSIRSPYFIQTSFSDSRQAKIIASIVQEFKWKQVVPVYEDSEYCNGIVPYLIDSFQEIDVSVPYRSIISPTATKEEILEELRKLKRIQTRVFVAHLTYYLGFRVFSIAKEEGMLEEGFAWITTYGLTDIVNLMGSSAADVMQGVVGVKPYVNVTRRLHDFKKRWRKKFHQEYPDSQITDPTVFGLWAYDTVWALALAAERVRMTVSRFQKQSITDSSTDLASIGSYSSGPELLQSIRRIEFDGMAWKFRLINNQLELQTFEILNVVGHGQRRIWLWSPKNGISGWRNSTDKFHTVIWPGNTEVVPKGWEWPTMGKKLRIGVPVNTGFKNFVDVERDPHSNNVTVEGYCIAIFRAVMKKLLYEFIPNEDLFEFIPFDDSSYDDLVYQVYLQKFDAVVGDVTILANRSLYVDFTLPYMESEISMLVPIKDKLKKDAWTFLQPLTPDLWLASGAFFILTGFVVWFLEHRINEKFRGSPAVQLGTVLHFSFSTLIFTHRENVLSNLSRIVVIVWLFVVLILKSSYIASLTSMLTVEQLQPTVTNLNDLIKNGSNVGYLKYSFMPSLLKRLNFNVSKLIPYKTVEDYHEALSNGRIVAVIDETPYLRFFVNQYCGKYTMIGTNYNTGGFGFVFPKGSLIAPEVSRAILKLRDSDWFVKMEENLYSNKSCHFEEGNDTNSSSLTFRSFWGLFVITGVASVTVLILYMASFIRKHRQLLHSADSKISVCRKLVKLVTIYDQMESPKAPKGIKVEEELTVGNVTTDAVISGPQSPLQKLLNLRKR